METIKTFDYIYEGPRSRYTYCSLERVYQCTIEKDGDQIFYRIQRLEESGEHPFLATFLATDFRFHFTPEVLPKVLSALVEIREKLIWLNDGKENLKDLTPHKTLKNFLKKLKSMSPSEMRTLKAQGLTLGKIAFRGILESVIRWREIKIFDVNADNLIIIKPIIPTFLHYHLPGNQIDIGRYGLNLNEDGTYHRLQFEDKFKIRNLNLLDDFINALQQAQEYLGNQSKDEQP